jgi:hypothetical protein
MTRGIFGLGTGAHAGRQPEGLSRSQQRPSPTLTTAADISGASGTRLSRFLAVSGLWRSGQMAGCIHPESARSGMSDRFSSRELPSSGGMEDRLNQDVNVAAVDPGDGVAEAHGNVAGEAGSEPENALLAAGAGKLAGVERGDRGLPVDGGDPGVLVDEAGEVDAAQPGLLGDDKPGGGFERVEAGCGGAER